MIKLFELVVLTVIITLAWRVAISKDMILGRLGDYFEEKVQQGEKFFDWFQCSWCFGSIAVVPAHLFAFGLGILPFEFNWQLLIRWPLVVFASCFISGMLWTIYNAVNAGKEKNEAQSEYYKFINYERENFDKENYFDEEV